MHAARRSRTVAEWPPDSMSIKRHHLDFDVFSLGSQPVYDM